MPAAAPEDRPLDVDFVEVMSGLVVEEDVGEDVED